MMIIYFHIYDTDEALTAIIKWEEGGGGFNASYKIFKPRGIPFDFLLIKQDLMKQFISKTY